MRARGFTLTDLVVVIVIIGILGVTILPRFAQRSTFDQVGFHDQVLSALQFARKIAVASRRNVCVRATAAQIIFLVDPQLPDGVTPNCTAATDGAKVPLKIPGQTGSVLTPPSGAGITPSVAAAAFWFDPAGRPSATGINIQFVGAQRIFVERETGYVH